VVLALEGVCKGLDGIVGTIGKIEISPNSLNVIPGTVTLGMEIRSLQKTLLNQAISLFKDELDRIVKRRKITINLKTKLSSKPVIFNSKMVGRIVRVCEKLNMPYLEVPSGAGHDANHLAEITPTGMIFVPSKDGRSHCPEEWSEFKNIGLGVEVLANTIIELDKEEAL